MSKENKRQPFAGFAGSTGNPPEPPVEPPVEPTPQPEPEPEPIKMVPKRIKCPRCNGTGTFVSSRTGVRAKTAFEPLTDSSRKCPRCKGRKSVKIMITEEQAEAEKAKKAQIRKDARGAIDATARAAKAALDNE